MADSRLHRTECFLGQEGVFLETDGCVELKKYQWQCGTKNSSKSSRLAAVFCIYQPPQGMPELLP